MKRGHHGNHLLEELPWGSTWPQLETTLMCHCCIENMNCRDLYTSAAEAAAYDVSNGSAGEMFSLPNWKSMNACFCFWINFQNLIFLLMQAMKFVISRHASSISWPLRVLLRFLIGIEWQACNLAPAAPSTCLLHCLLWHLLSSPQAIQPFSNREVFSYHANKGNKTEAPSCQGLCHTEIHFAVKTYTDRITQQQNSAIPWTTLHFTGNINRRKQ